MTRVGSGPPLAGNHDFRLPYVKSIAYKQTVCLESFLYINPFHFVICTAYFQKKILQVPVSDKLRKRNDYLLLLIAICFKLNEITPVPSPPSLSTDKLPLGTFNISEIYFFRTPKSSALQNEYHHKRCTRRVQPKCRVQREGQTKQLNKAVYPNDVQYISPLKKTTKPRESRRSKQVEQRSPFPCKSFPFHSFP